MKLKLISQSNYFIILTAFLLLSCKEKSVEPDDTKEYEISNPQVQSLISLGFRKDMIVDKGDYYIIESDIIFPKKEIVSKLEKEQQWAVDYLVSKNRAQDIVVKIDSSIPLSGADNWRPEISTALSEWNNILGCMVNLRIDNNATNPDITVFGVDHTYFNSYNVQAQAEFPTSDGRPGNRVLICLDFNYNENIPSSRKIYNFAHELGHCIGFRHTNWSSRGEGSSNANLIPATPNTDVNSIMNGGTALNSWVGFSVFDKKSSIALYTDGDWISKPGSLKQVSVGNQNNIWGLNSTGQIYNWNGTDWLNISPGASLNQISAASDGTVWGTNSIGQIYRWNGTNWLNVTPGARLKQVSVGSATNIWGTNSSDQIFRWNGSDWSNITPNSRLKQVSVASDGTIYGVNSNNQIYRWSGTDWLPVPGGISQISVGSLNTIWGINSLNQIFKWDGSDWQNITYSGRLSNISVGSDGSIWGVNSTGQVFKGIFNF